MTRRTHASAKPPKEPVTYSPAPAVEAVALSLLDGHFPDLQEIRIGYVFRSKAHVQDGHIKFGSIKKNSPAEKVLHGLDYLMVIAKDVWDKLNDHCRHALVFHELRHAKIEFGDKGPTLGIRRHDVEMFQDELTTFGAWHDGLDILVANVKQLPLFPDAAKRLRPEAREAALAPSCVTSEKPNGQNDHLTVLVPILGRGNKINHYPKPGMILTAMRDVQKGGKLLLEAGQKVEVAGWQSEALTLQTTDGLKLGLKSLDALGFDPDDQPKPGLRVVENKVVETAARA